jgi:hypothetical protein
MPSLFASHLVVLPPNRTHSCRTIQRKTINGTGIPRENGVVSMRRSVALLSCMIRSEEQVEPLIIYKAAGGAPRH